MDIKNEIISSLKKAVKNLTDQDIDINLEHPAEESHGDYASNIALTLFASEKRKAKSEKLRTPMELAQEIASRCQRLASSYIDKVEAVKPGFINFWISKEYLVENLSKPQSFSKTLSGKKIMVEFAHPNTHKEMHIGHMRTLITGEAVVRLLEQAGAKVFRANYQGDIGPHVAKAMIGIQKIMRDRKLSLDQVKSWSNKDKAHFLGEGYVVGNQLYDSGEMKNEINEMNSILYGGNSSFRPEEQEKTKNLYKETRQWSLDYYDEFYERFHAKFDRLFFESEMVEDGKKIVLDNLGKIFKKENGAIIFPGEKYGLHTRVFITQVGHPTYEGKEMANAFAEYKAFPFDLKIHVVASEQAGYFKVVFKALELIDPEKFKNKQMHISMGMIHLSDRKMSSRTGDILTVDWLLDQVREQVEKLASEGRIDSKEKDKTIEQIVIGAVKYSVLKVGTGQDVKFDIEKSVSLEGNSGPYLQYTFARTQSVLSKNVILNEVKDPEILRFTQNDILIENKIEPAELLLLRTLNRFPEVIEEAGKNYAPNLLCNYLFDLAQKFNLFYQKHKIIANVILNEVKNLNHHREILRFAQDDRTRFRLALTQATGIVLKTGLNLLGIQAPEKM